MTIDDVRTYIVDTFPGLVFVDAWGEQSAFYNPGHRFARGAYFCTIKQKDGDNDKASHIDREGIWRLNFGLPKHAFIELFGEVPTRPAKGGIVEGPWNFTKCNLLMPHPVYGWMSWVAVLNPSASTFSQCKPLMALAYEKSVKSFETRVKKEERQRRSENP